MSRPLRTIPILLLPALLLACGEDDLTPVGDRTPPSTITDLAVSEVTASSVTLRWTAPADGPTRSAAVYDIRYAEEPITESTFDRAWTVGTVPDPGAPNSREELTVDGLRCGRTFHFTIRSTDVWGNESGLSNPVEARVADRPGPDAEPPGMISDLRVSATGRASISLYWTAPGDDGDVGRACAYEVRYGSAPIDAVSWENGLPFDTALIPAEAGEREDLVVTGLEEGTLYTFAVRAVDDAPNLAPESNWAVARTQTLDAPGLTGSWAAEGDVRSMAVDGRGHVFTFERGVGILEYDTAGRVVGRIPTDPADLSSVELVLRPGGGFVLVSGYAVRFLDPAGAVEESWSIPVDRRPRLTVRVTGAALAPDGTLLVAEGTYDTLRRYTPDGRLLGRWEFPSDEGAWVIRGLAVDHLGWIYAPVWERSDGLHSTASLLKIDPDGSVADIWRGDSMVQEVALAGVGNGEILVLEASDRVLDDAVVESFDPAGWRRRYWTTRDLVFKAALIASGPRGAVFLSDRVRVYRFE